MSGVQVVFCIDTEGPCVDPGNPELLATWEAVDVAMDRLFDPRFRSRFPDPSGGGLRIGWFFLTWTGFRTNPRGRAFGYHQVRDHYLARWAEAIDRLGDEQCWHYHHPSPSGVGNEWGLDWTVCREYEQVLSRQILEREHFPACYRAGGTIMDPVSSRWVDAWFSSDYSNRAPVDVPGLVDWSGGVREWGLYHPSPEDFRRPGPGRRRMARCLDLHTGLHHLGEDELKAAFERAERGQPAILACFDHDYRDIAGRIDDLREMLHRVAGRHPHVPWRYAAPSEAVRAYLGVPAEPRLEMDASFHGGAVRIGSTAPLFQPIPWLAVRTRDGAVHHVEAGLERLDRTHWRWWPPRDLDWVEAGLGGSTDLGCSAVTRVRSDGTTPGGFLERPMRAHPVHPRSIWEHSKLYAELCVARASGSAPEMDAVRQTVEILRPRLRPGQSVLDVGCAAGHAFRSLRELGLAYHGIDTYARGIEIGRRYLAGLGLPPERLRVLAIEDLPPEERHDAVICLNTLLYLPTYHLPLEVMARAARSVLVIRSSFGDRAEVRYLPDVLLEPGFQGMRAYFQVFARAEVESFLSAEGFRVGWEADRRQAEKFAGRPEVVGGIELPYEFLIAERVRPVPDEETILGEGFGAAAREWRERKRGGPNP